MLIGAHVSTSGGVQFSPPLALQDNCECFQIFTKSQLQWNSKPLESDQVIKWFEAWENSNWLPCFIHDSYLINLSSPDEEHRQKSIDAFVDEMERAALLCIPWVNTHPGSHKGAGKEAGLSQCAKSLQEILNRTEDLGVGILLETTAGQGNDLGSVFVELGELIERTGSDERVGVCVDTCHIFAAGYDFRSKSTYEQMWKLFDEQIGMQRLKAFHLNDCKFPLGSHRDRHAEIGRGEIGAESFTMIVQDLRFKNLPGVCELPDDLGQCARSIELLKKLRATDDISKV